MTPPAEPAGPEQADQHADQHAVQHTLEVLRSRGAAHAEPVRLHVIEVLAARAAAAPEPLHGLLARRVQHLAQALAGRLSETSATARPQPRARQPHPSPLADLLRRFEPDAVAGDGTTAAAMSRVPELKAVRAYRSTWTQWRADRQLQQSLASVPHNPGPLNSHAVALRAFTRMRSLSPGHLNRYVAYLETLAWLEHADSAATPAAARRPAARERVRKG